MIFDPYDAIATAKVFPAPKRWGSSCTHTECSMHQLSPYIGKIKSSIAGELIERYSQKNDLVVDPFAGAGTIPFEAVLRGRRAYGADLSPYAEILSKAKLFPPSSEAIAINLAEAALCQAKSLPRPNLRLVPQWVKAFFHPETLCEILQFAEIVRRPGNEFLLACLLGILHHQRPGFLSYPSSHLVPYLRDQKYPRSRYPEMYAYRELRSRLLAKIKRCYRRFLNLRERHATFRRAAVQDVKFPKTFDALITSPPYMNALDYGRDNRLRLWLTNPINAESLHSDVTQRREAFIDAISSLAKKTEIGLKKEGYCIFVVGEEVRRSFDAHPSAVVIEIINAYANSLRLRKIISDNIPDVRRSRHECHGVKTEHLLVFQRN